MADDGDDRTTVHPPLGLYLLGAEGGAERTAVEAHLAGCPTCLREAAAFGAAIDGLILLDPRVAAALLAAQPPPDTST